MLYLNPRFSVITVTYNAEKGIGGYHANVISQTIIMNISSSTVHQKDGTMAIVNRYRDRISQVVSEPDKGTL